MEKDILFTAVYPSSGNCPPVFPEHIACLQICWPMDSNKKKQKDMKVADAEKPPFFSNWKKMYVFVLLFELLLIILFIAITQKFGV